MSNAHDGAIDISPALNATEIRNYNELVAELVAATYKPTHPTAKRFKSIVGDAKAFWNEMRLGLEITVTERETDEGTLLVRTSSRLSFPQTEYSTVLSSLSLVDLLRKTFPKHSLSGTVISVDREYSSAQKVTVHEGNVYGVSGTVAVVWEDGSKPTTLSSLGL